MHKNVSYHISDRILGIHVAVRSKDYFVTLGTTLENISTDLGGSHPALAQRLNDLAFDLDYLQRNYIIIPKAEAGESPQAG